MSQVMKTFLCVFLVILMSVTAAQIMTGYLQVLNAQNMHSMIINELEDSHYAPLVMRECFRKAKKNQYELEIMLYKEKGGIYQLTKEAEVPNKLDYISSGEVNLSFWYGTPFFGMKQMHMLCGSGR